MCQRDGLLEGALRGWFQSHTHQAWEIMEITASKMWLLPAFLLVNSRIILKERVWKFVFCRNKYFGVGEGGNVHTLIFKGSQQKSLLTKAGHPPVGMPHHACTTWNKSFCLTHSLWTTKDHSTFEESLHGKTGKRDTSTVSRSCVVKRNVNKLVNS